MKAIGKKRAIVEIMPIVEFQVMIFLVFPGYGF
jgi:hypothetical protein